VMEFWLSGTGAPAVLLSVGRSATDLLPYRVQ
jgi:hypothetical protein